MSCKEFYLNFWRYVDAAPRGVGRNKTMNFRVGFDWFQSDTDREGWQRPWTSIEERDGDILKSGGFLKWLLGETTEAESLLEAVHETITELEDEKLHPMEIRPIEIYLYVNGSTFVLVRNEKGHLVEREGK